MSSSRVFFISVVNFITLSRLIAGLLSIYLFQNQSLSVYLSIAFLYIFISDLLDGYLARKHGATTKFGSIFDYVVDRFNIYLQISLLLSSSVSTWIFTPFFFRDLIYIFIQTYVSLPRVSGTKQLSLISTVLTYSYVFLISNNLQGYIIHCEIILFSSYMLSFINILHRAYRLRRKLADEMRNDIFV